MSVDDVADRVARLDRLVPRAGASVIIKQDFDGPVAGRIVVGNWSGYMRLGIELLKAATAAGRPGPEGCRLEPALDFLDQEMGEALTFDLVDTPSYLSTSPTEQARSGCSWVSLPLLVGSLWLAMRLVSRFFG